MLKIPTYTIAGLDYGSKLAGTSVLAVLHASAEVEFFCSEKGKDADIFLEELIVRMKLKKVFIDAPLSLPGVYRKLPGFSDYFFRQADRDLQAMSPMFLGGLTARAIKLKDKLLPDKVQFIETYPSGWVRFYSPAVSEYRNKVINPENYYLKNIDKYPLIIRPESITSWHHVDALLALMSGIRYENQQHTIFGDAEEGMIVI